MSNNPCMLPNETSPLHEHQWVFLGVYAGKEKAVECPPNIYWCECCGGYKYAYDEDELCRVKYPLERNK